MIEKSKKEKFAVVSVKAFIEWNSKILILRESLNYKHGANHDRYVMPGGKVSENEHFLDALKRELKEECDITVKIGRPFHVDEWWINFPGKPKHIVGVYFHCSVKNSKVLLAPDFASYEWIRPENYNKWNVNSAAKRAFKSFLKLK